MHRPAPICSKNWAPAFAAGAALLAALGCGAADPANDAPEFMTPPFAATGGAPSALGPSAAGSTTSAPAASASAGNGAVPGGGEGTRGNVPLAPAGSSGGSSAAGGAPSASPAPVAAAGGASSAPAAAGGAGGAGAGSVGAAAGPGRVGLELCPPGPFASPFANGAAVQPVASVGANDFFIFEGPVWTGDALYLSEIANDDTSQVDRFTPQGGLERGVFPNTGSNGMALDGEGNLLLAAHDVGAISRLTLAGVLTRGAQQRNGARFNSPNDLVVRGDGNIYFTDPDFQAPPTGRTQDGTFVYRIAPPLGAGEITVVDAGMNNPNGITLSPDGNTLYVSAAGVLREYDLDAAGAATVVGDLTNQIGTPDGMTVDCAGNIYAVQNDARTITVFSPDGQVLDVIGGQNVFAQGVTNVAFGGPNRTTLFVTTFSQGNSGGLYSVELAVPGFPY